MIAKQKWHLLCAFGVLGVAVGLFFLVRKPAGSEWLERLPDSPSALGIPKYQADRIARAEGALRKDPSDLSLWLALGQVYHANGFLEHAVASYTTLMELNPEPSIKAKLHYYLGDIARFQARNAEALDRFRRALYLDSDYVPTHLALGEIFYKQGELEPSAAAYAEALRLDPSNPHAMLGAARARAGSGRDAEAIDLLATLYETNPDFNGGKGLLARLLDGKGEGDRAAEVRAGHRRGAVLPPKDPWLEEMHAFCYDVQRLKIRYEDFKNAGNLEAAFALLDRVEELDPENWTAQLLRGLALAETGRVAAAADRYWRALRFGGDPATVYPLLIKALVSIHQYDEAERVAKEAVQIVANSVDVLVELAGISIIKRRRDDAIRYFEAALSIDPYHERALRYLAEILESEGRADEALDRYRMLATVAPDDPFAPTRMGVVFMSLGRLDAASKSLGRAARSRAKSHEERERLAQAFCSLAQRQLEADDDAAALDSFSLAAEVDPDAVDAYVGRTELLVRLQRYEEAERSIQPLMRLSSDDPGAYLALGDIQFAQGKRAEAKASWERAAGLPGAERGSPLREALALRLQQVVE